MYVLSDIQFELFFVFEIKNSGMIENDV